MWWLVHDGASQHGISWTLGAPHGAGYVQAVTGTCAGVVIVAAQQTGIHWGPVSRANGVYVWAVCDPDTFCNQTHAHTFTGLADLNQCD